MTDAHFTMRLSLYAQDEVNGINWPSGEVVLRLLGVSEGTRLGSRLRCFRKL